MITSLSLVIAPRRLRLVAWLMVVLWTLALAASVVWNARLMRKTMLQVATQEARTSCNKDMHYLLNPAYMTRQVHAMKAQEDDVIGHITSLKPLRPENAPDAWEAAALRAIQPGETEVVSRELLHGRRFLRYMKPLVTTAACLECHRDQGYKAGERNSGISVAVPLDPYLAMAQAELWRVAWVHIGLWALGMLGIGWGARQMRQRLDQQLQAAAALRASEECFRTVADFTADMEYWRLPDGSLAYVSPSCERLTGYSAAEFLQTPELLASIVHSEDLQRCEGHFHGASETTAGLERCELEFRIRTRSGEVRWISHVCQPVVDRDGKFQGRRVSNRDLTERKQAAEELRQSKERYRSILNATPDAIVIIDTAGRVVMISPGTVAMFGYKGAEELLGKWFAEFIVPEERARAVFNLGLIFQGQSPGLMEYRCLRSGGSIFDVEAKGEAIRDAAGQQVQMVAIVRDATERKRAQAVLRESEERFRNLLRDVPGVAVQGYRLDGTTTYWNQASETLYGYTAQDAVGRSLLDLVVPPEMREDVQQAMRQMAETGQPIPASELSLMRKDGSRVAVFSSHVVVQIPGRAAEMFCLDIDLTKRKLAETALRESELKFRSLFETAGGAILLFADDRWVDCNAKALSIFGGTREQIIGAHPSRFSPPMQPDGRSSEEEASKKINLAFTVGPQVFEWEHCRADGTPFAAEVSLNRLDLEGKPQIQAIVHDITKRKLAETALRESEDRFRGVVEGAAMPIFVTVEMNFSYLNPAALSLLGATTPEQVLGQPILSRIHPDCHASIQKRAVKVFQGQRGMAPPQAEVYLKLDGTPVPVEATASPIT